MANFTVNDYLNVLCLRNQLVCVGKKQLLDVYKDYENYITFLDSVYVFSEIDSAFLLYNKDYVDKVENIVQIHRYDTDDPEVKNVVNTIIGYLNGLKTYSDEYKDALMQAYHSYNEEKRNVQIESDNLLLQALAYDAVVVAGLANENMEIVTDDDLFLSSMNYLMNTIPEFFDNAQVKIRAITRLDELSKKGRPFNKRIRTYSKETLENFQKIKVREE